MRVCQHEVPPSIAEFVGKGHRANKAVAARPEKFGRYDPVTHTLYVDAKAHAGPSATGKPLALAVGNQGRLQAVIDAGLVPSKTGANTLGLGETAMHDHIQHGPSGHHGKHHVFRKEDFGCYDPISSTLAFKVNENEGEYTIKVGDRGRLRSVLESGKATQLATGVSRRLCLQGSFGSSGRWPLAEGGCR